MKVSLNKPIHSAFAGEIPPIYPPGMRGDAESAQTNHKGLCALYVCTANNLCVLPVCDYDYVPPRVGVGVVPFSESNTSLLISHLPFCLARV